MNEFDQAIAGFQGKNLRAGSTEILQAHLGLLCNQQCAHCHFNCGPDRTEVMSWPVMEGIVRLAAAMRPRLVDISGGAPELNPRLKDLIGELCAAGHRVQLRSNISALVEPGLDGLPAFLRHNRVKLVASLPCYAGDDNHQDCGDGVFEKCIRALGLLAEAGYSVEPGLFLNMVYNPGGAALPGKRAALETAYRRELYQCYNITFSRLSLITSAPTGSYPVVWPRRIRDLESTQLLKGSFNPGAIENLNCRHQVTVRWDGVIFDCELNLALGIRAAPGADYISTLDPDRLFRRRIITGKHCFGCTAAFGSTCSRDLKRGMV
jgi:radical SAM/Cys-rich protein